MKGQVKIMKKTFYSVEFAVWGADSTSTMWFDNLEEAKKFANHNYRDNPVRHTYSNPEKIAEIESIISEQK